MELQLPIRLKSSALEQRMASIAVDVNNTTMALLSGESKGIKITSIDGYQEAAEELRKVVTLKKLFDEKRKEITAPIDAAKKQVMDEARPYTDAFDRAERALKCALADWADYLEAERRKAEAEAEEARRKEAEKLEAKADKAEEKGKFEMADALREQASTTVATSVAVTAPVPEAKGVHTRKIYGAKITDATALLHAAVAQSILGRCGYDAGTVMQYLTESASKGVPNTVAIVDEKLVNKMASTLKDALDWPGVKVEATTSISSRSL